VTSLAYDLLRSSILIDGVNSLSDFHVWFEERLHMGNFQVEISPLDEMKDWRLDKKSGVFGHKSGKFFKICGLKVEYEREGLVAEWYQPIVNQPEVGLLGLLAKKINGIIHILVQAKMEPGNVGFIQISPTVQATKSNYTRVHGGRSPKFVEYFLGNTAGRVLFDQLRSEQGSRYYRKRNRNMLVLLDDDVHVDCDEDFFWLTLGQLRELHKFPNLIHLDCRSIVGAMPLAIADETYGEKGMLLSNSENMTSLQCSDSSALKPLRRLISWFTHQKVDVVKNTYLTSLDLVEGWSFYDGGFKNRREYYFDIVGVTVFAPSREVSSWSQPLIKNVAGGIIALLAQVHNGVLHFLIQARFEPGLINSVEMAPTIQYTPKNYESNSGNLQPLFTEYLIENHMYEILVDTRLSDEGGRFFKSEQRHIIIKLQDEEKIEVPNNFAWMTLSQLQYFGSMELTVNIELRTLLFCLSLN